MTPTGLRRVMQRTGLRAPEIARQAGCHFMAVTVNARAYRPRVMVDRRIRLAVLSLQADMRAVWFRTARRARAARHWSGAQPYSPGVLAAVAILDREGKAWLADPLLRCWPVFLPWIAAHVAADALAQNMPDVWDALAFGHIADLDLADKLYNQWAFSRYDWQPPRGSLIP